MSLEAWDKTSALKTLLQHDLSRTSHIQVLIGLWKRSQAKEEETNMFKEKGVRARNFIHGSEFLEEEAFK